METVNHSYRALRRGIGILGISLPVLLIIGNFGNVEGSISNYYYTKMSTVFTGVLITFGLILFTYRGTEEPGKKISENFLTNIGGMFALLVALVPMKLNIEPQTFFYSHNDSIRGWIHNISAVLFIFLMGVIVLTKFSQAKYYKNLYKVLGTLVLAGLAFTIFAFIYEEINGGNSLFNGAVFWGESFCLWAFGFAWLRRGVPKGSFPSNKLKSDSNQEKQLQKSEAPVTV